MTAPVATYLSSPVPTTDQTFPTLTQDQIARVAIHGRVRHVESGEVLVALGGLIPAFFIVAAGSIEVVQPGEKGEMTVGDVRAGNIKRVASAVGEGSIAVSFVHQVLAD